MSGLVYFNIRLLVGLCYVEHLAFFFSPLDIHWMAGEDHLSEVGVNTETHSLNGSVKICLTNKHYMTFL